MQTETCCLVLQCVYCVCCQSKHQKHQAFEAELHANADRIRGVIDTGNALIQRGACAGSEDAVKVYLSSCYSLIISCKNVNMYLSNGLQLMFLG